MPSAHFRQQWLLLSITLLLVGSSISWNLFAEYTMIDGRERGLLVAQTKVVEKNLEHQLTATNHALDSIRYDLPALNAEHDGMAGVTHRLEVMRGAMPTTRAITIFDKSGTLVARSPDKFVGENFSDREYFQLARMGKDPARLYVARPFLAKTGEYVLNVSKVLLDERGTFAGVLLVSLGPEYFDTLLQSVLYAPDMRATLMHGGGKVIFEAPSWQNSTGEESATAPDPLLLQHLRDGQTNSQSGTVAPFSDTDRLLIWHTIQPLTVPMDTPLLVGISREITALFASWRLAVFVQGGLFGILALMTTLGLFFYQKRQLANARLLAAQDAQRRKAEESLRESEENLAITLDSIGDAVIATDATGRVTRMNPTAERLSGWPLDEARNRNLADVFHIVNARDRDKVADPVEQVLTKGTVVGLANHTILLSRDGREYQIADSAAPIRNAAGEIQGIVLVFSDVTEKYQAEEERHRLESQLRQAHKMEAIGTLAGGIAHDFNNILAIIFGYNELALLESDPATRRHHLEELRAAATRARDLVQQILAFSHKAEQQRQPLQISSILKETLKLLRASIPTTIEIRQDISSSGLVLADPTQIHQIIMNLCTNAYYAMRETGGILAVALTEVTIGPGDYGFAGLTPGNYVQLEVNDTGCGMDSKTKEKVFEPYFTTKNTGEGTGLGLAVVHGIVKSHHGHITVFSEPGKGTSFRVYLPLTDQPIVLRPSPSRPPERKGKGEQVLFVDDETQIRGMMEVLLSANGYRVTSCADGKQAWDIFQENPGRYAIVVTDMTMPAMNGADLARKVLALRPHTPVILCTGQSDLINGEKALAMGISAYLNKPTPSDTLLGVIRAALDKAGAEA